MQEHKNGSTRSTRSSRLARLARQSRTCRFESSRVEPSGIWALLHCRWHDECAFGFESRVVVTYFSILKSRSHVSHQLQKWQRAMLAEMELAKKTRWRRILWLPSTKWLRKLLTVIEGLIILLLPLCVLRPILFVDWRR